MSQTFKKTQISSFALLNETASKEFSVEVLNVAIQMEEMPVIGHFHEQM